MASVAIGVAAFVAVTFTTRSTQTAFDEIFQSLAGRASLEIVAPIGQAIPASVAADVAGISGVEAIAPRLQRPAIMIVKEKDRVQLVAAAIDLQRDAKVHEYKIVDGQPLTDSKGALLSKLLAESLGVKVGDEVGLLTRSGMIPLKIVGLFASNTSTMSAQGAGLLIPLRGGQVWFRAKGQLDTIQIVLDKEADEEQVKKEIESRLPNNAELRLPTGRSEMAKATVLSTNQALFMARAFILLVAVFVITNTFLISVTQRRRQLGILRAIGGARGQIAALVMSEAFVMGVAGTIVGSVIGVLIARYLNMAMGAMYGTTLPPLHLDKEPFLLAALFGIGMSMVGAIVPALKASRLNPLDALRDVLPDEIEGGSRWLVAFGFFTVFVCAVLLALSITGYLPSSVAVYAGVLGLVGLVLILPAALPTITRTVAAILPPRMRVEGRIASRQLLIHRSRTTLTVGVVFIAASAAIGLASTVLDNVQDVKDWYNKTLIADFFIRATMPDMATGLAADLPDGLGDEILEVDGVEGIDSIRLISAKAEKENVILIVRGFDDDSLQQFDVVRGDESKIREQMADGEVVIGSVLSQRTNLNVGDSLPLETDEGIKPFRIAAIVTDYQAGGLTVYMDRGTAEKQLDIGGVDVYVVKADREKIDTVRRDLLDLVQDKGLILQSFSELQTQIEGMMAGVDAGLWGLVALGLLVATFGVVNTLMISVLEQTFEFGLLRVVAATRAQIRKIIFAQALIVAVMAMAPAVITGMGIAYLINLATYSVTGRIIDFQFHPSLTFGAFFAGLLTIVIAAWAPAERASRVPLGGMLRVR
ncbi:FtsX-like permease family protein [Lacipirellula sp.]|uniref:FtsX-like permease family protein n=1 Tax=Lacipirellula sp. TaxID=2691419 RepID=UPI003D0B3698